MCTTLQEPTQWAQTEFALADLGDVRLNRRLVQVASALARCPSGTLPQALPTWKELKAAYRLFNNERVSHEAILKPHCEQTRQRCLEPGEYLWIEDTTGLDFSTRPATEGLGQIGNQYGRGLKLHTTLAARVEHWTLEQTPELSLLGVLGQKCWARPPSQVKRGTERWRKRLARRRESERWGQVLEQMPAPPKEVSWTLITDREGDIYEVLENCCEKQMDFVVRAHYRRCLVGSDESAFDAVAKAPALGTFELELRARGGQPARRARLELRSVEVILKGAWRPEGTRLPLAVTVVEAREIDPPAGVEPIHWVLFTSFSARGFVEARRVVARYAQRWLIEEYHKVLKTGVNVEESQLQTAQRLQALTAVLVVVGVRLLNTKLLARTRPDQIVEPGSFGPEIMELLSARFEKPITGWTYQSVLVAIAKMGGFLGRRHDGNPGWLTIWRGWQRLQTMAEGLTSLREQFRGVEATRCG